ncbi:MAG: SpoIIE family protein phosphatase [Desulfobacterales bacterium]|jgi:sigma-B regulation protein RsbU (phosphoserine phosphatase)|nr:SpoIIE family protein phosphatase [Desulfobacterales bacterium]
MSRFDYYRAKNSMLISALVSNLVGVAVVIFLTQQSADMLPFEILRLTNRIDRFFMPAAFIVPFVLILLYERPIRGYLKRSYQKRPLSEDLVRKARRRLLNEPFFLIGLSFCIWMTAALVYSGAFWAQGSGRELIQQAFFRSFYTGLITVTVAFFVLEFILQRRVAPYFFPNGGLSTTPGTLRIRIRTRLFALLLASNIIPLVAILQHLGGASPAGGLAHLPMERMTAALTSQIFLFMGIGLWVTFLVSSNLTRPLAEITSVLRKVKNGLFETKVRVTSNDEIGYAGDVINEMTEGLLERDRIKQSLTLAKEVQQSLFPVQALKTDGFEAAGRSIYCDETGGDYYDFIPMAASDGPQWGVAVGDVSGHGIPAALLMATVRSSLRQRASHPGSLDRIMADVNRQITSDVGYSGEFITMFFLVIDPVKMELEWVRAGHDPALLYDPGTDSFEALGGTGLALGIDGNCRCSGHRRDGILPGQVILLGTDGLWEAANPKGEMLGKQPIHDAIRENCSLNANEILESILATLEKFQAGAKREDDVTLVIIKVGGAADRLRH